ncbi:MAG: 5'-nucleotidase C-terminal domain-containing protein [Synergistaceae bacterium]|nr:5'-nucleotidase C-terminal domain-containing protein [Synergistaceae bacterium]
MSELPANIAVFKASFDDQSGGMYLACSQGYLSVVASGGQAGIGYVLEQASGSLWTIEDGQYMKSSDYYAEYYSAYSDFTVYQKKYDSYNYQFRFYRVTAGQEEETEAYRLPVFETSDVHGCLVYTTDTPYQYRMAYIADKVNDVRNNDPSRTVLLDGGDIFQGELISKREGGRSLSAAYDLMKYDAVTIGNHDFDWGVETVFDSRDKTMLDYVIDGKEKPNTVPALASNILENGRQISLADPYLILDKKALNAGGESVNVRIAVIGFAEDYTRSIMTDKFKALGYSIMDMTEGYKQVNRIAAELEREGKCHATILLAHGDANVVAEALGEGTAVDLVLGGHTHQNILGRTAWGLPYMEPRNAAQYYCRTNLIFKTDEAGKAVFSGTDALQAVSAEQSTKEQNEASGKTELDPAVEAATDYFLEGVLQDLKRTVGYIDTPVERYVYLPDSGERATTAGNWSSSIMKRSVDADVAMINAHGLRTDFLLDDSGKKYISVADVFKMYPFDNTIYLYELSYDEFLTVLSYAMTEGGSGLLSNMTGIDCYFVDGAVNALVTEDGTVIYRDGEWTPGWKEKKLRFAVNSYTATSDRPSNGVSNPLVAWNDSDRLLSSDQNQFESAVRVLSSEAASGDGRLDIDTSPHFINLAYSASPVFSGSGNGSNGCNAMSGMEVVVRSILFVIALELVFMLRKMRRH